MGRHKSPDRPVTKGISLKSSLVKMTDAALMDPLTGQPQYGLWSELVESLLDKWIKGEVSVRIQPFRMNLSPGSEAPKGE